MVNLSPNHQTFGRRSKKDDPLQQGANNLIEACWGHLIQTRVRRLIFNSISFYC